MTNYRPISLSVVSKVFEKAMHSRWSQHLHAGFRKGISTENAAFRLIDSVFKSVNKKMHVRGIFCDLSKTFDCITPEMLLAKLLLYEIWGVQVLCN
jgi:hypothetical protein